MPTRQKRKAEEYDPLKSDSEDSTYNASASRSARAKPSRSQQGKPSRKRQRREYRDDDDGSDELTDESDLNEASFEAKVDEEELEIDENSGRPKRKAAKQRPTYRDDDTDESIEDTTDLPAQKVTPSKKKGKSKSLVLKLNVGTPQPTAPTRKSIRARSGSVGVARPASSEVQAQATRRSSRIAHDDSETIVKLTDSGRHADIVHAGTRSPEAEAPRTRRGGKGIKKPSASVVYEQDEEIPATKNRRAEIAASQDLDDDEPGDPQAETTADTQVASQDDAEVLDEAQVDEIPESAEDEPEAEDDDEDPPRRAGRHNERKPTDQSADGAPSRSGGLSAHEAIQSAHKTRSKNRSSQKGGREESSDFEPGADEGGEEDVSDSSDSRSSPRKATQPNDENNRSPGTRGGQAAKGKSRSQRPTSDEHESEVAEEVAEELAELQQERRPRRHVRTEIVFDRKPNTRTKKKEVDYRIVRPETFGALEDEGSPSTTTPSRRGRGGGGGGGNWQRSLHTIRGPFGGIAGPDPVLAGPGGIGAAAGANSDSSDDESMQRPRVPGVGGALGMTPTAAVPSGFGLLPPPPGQAHAPDAFQGTSGTPANLGKIKDKQLLADADPLGVDQNVNFDGVGGLQGHIDQLKEMVALPLLYPEVFQRYHMTPPRGVLFHGPPGTGKTLLARALASSVSSQGRKVTFYMRKGADALSKWVGEAERQLRLLFEEARKTQPSIIFFDEIDGLAPVRSSKQDQIHASLVSTLLALMDGMDGRGQVIIIGATNRPDSVDPALRRPGRFDREFYFPLPNTEARRAIIDIHTKGWEPPLATTFKNEIASVTKGYGGADLRALCTEAALNAVQRRYPQIYKSTEKLIIKPETINVTAKDFMISIKKMVPASERSGSSGAAPLPKHIEPLLRHSLTDIENVVAEILPQKKTTTALEEAEFEDAEDDRGMKMERMQQEFERSRIFRPRLLIKGPQGMGQQYLAGALLNHFEGLHVQAFDLPTLLSDSGRSSEAAIVQLFTEVRRHKPSVIYIPNVDTWYRTVGQAAISTFRGLMRTLVPTEPVLLLGILESQEAHDGLEQQMIKDLFGLSKKNTFDISKPDKPMRREYFSAVIEYLHISPADFPEPLNRKKRKIEVLMPAPPDPLKPPAILSKSELKEQKKRDRFLLSALKTLIQPIMDQIKWKHKKFRTGVIDESQIRYLYDEDDPGQVSTDLPADQRPQDHPRPYEKDVDSHGSPGLVERATGKFFYNLETVTIEKRLSNGYYKRPKDFLADIKKLTKDAKTIEDQERLLKAMEVEANVMVDMANIEYKDPLFMSELEAMYLRECKREKEMVEKAKGMAVTKGQRLQLMPSKVPAGNARSTASTEQSSGPVMPGQPISNGTSHPPVTPLNRSNPSNPSQPSQRSNLTNGLSVGISDLSDLQGHSNQSNGASVPSRGEDDTHMTNSTERETVNSSFGPSAQSQLPFSYTGGPTSLQQRMSVPGSLSQRSAITPMAEGSNPHDYTNYASTTSSDKQILGSSGPFTATQSSHAKNEGPDLSMIPPPMDHSSQVPDTQGWSTQSSAGHGSNPSSNPQPYSQPPSQNPAVPPFPRPSNLHSLLNSDTPLKTSTAVSNLVIDRSLFDQLLEALVIQTSGCSVEQLEQIYSALMDRIWKTRGNWNRIRVAEELKVVFEDVLEDIKHCQDIGQRSLEVSTYE